MIQFYLILILILSWLSKIPLHRNPEDSATKNCDLSNPISINEPSRLLLTKFPKIVDKYKILTKLYIKIKK